MTIFFSGSQVANVELSDSFNTWRLSTNKIITDAASTSSNNVFSGTAVFSDTVALNSTLSTTGATTFSNTVSVVGATTLSNTLSVTGAATLSNTIAVTGDATFSGSVTANSFSGDGTNLTNAGASVTTDSTNHDLLVPFTGINSGKLVTANVNASFTFNPSTGALSATSFTGDGTNLTNAGADVSTSSTDSNYFVPFTGISSGKLVTANVNAAFTFNPNSGRLSASSVKSSAFVDGSNRTLTIRDEANNIVWGG